MIDDCIGRMKELAEQCDDKASKAAKMFRNNKRKLNKVIYISHVFSIIKTQLKKIPLDQGGHPDYIGPSISRTEETWRGEGFRTNSHSIQRSQG